MRQSRKSKITRSDVRRLWKKPETLVVKSKSYSKIEAKQIELEHPLLGPIIVRRHTGSGITVIPKDPERDPFSLHLGRSGTVLFQPAEMRKENVFHSGKAESGTAEHVKAYKFLAHPEFAGLAMIGKPKRSPAQKIKIGGGYRGQRGFDFVGGRTIREIRRKA